VNRQEPTNGASQRIALVVGSVHKEGNLLKVVASTTVGGVTLSSMLV